MRTLNALFVATIQGLIAVIAAAVLFIGCARLEGWGMVVWSIPGTSARAGSIVPVYLRSNISKSYLIGLPDDQRTKMEVPFAYIEFYRSRNAAGARAKEYAEFAPLYMIAGRDGLPIRDRPSVSARRVYRLRLGETVKVLARAQGEAVFTGGSALPGEWYQVQAQDGTRGYVFSNTMTLYSEEKGGRAPVMAGTSVPNSALLDLLYAKPWRPAYYQIALDDDTVDPDLFSLQFGLFADAKNSQIRISLPGYSNVYKFKSVSSAGDWLQFEGSPLRIRFESEGSIIAEWQGIDPVLPEEGWANGMSAARFIRIDSSIESVRAADDARRTAELKSFFARWEQKTQSHLRQVSFMSEKAGILTIDSRGMFEWSHFDQLPAGFAPEQTGDSIQGIIRFGLHLGESLSSAWTGGFSLIVGDTDKSSRYDYVYRVEGDQLVVARAGDISLRGVTEDVKRGLGPISLYIAVK